MSTEDSELDERKIVTFTLGNRLFGIDMRSLIEIREWEEPTPLPSVPPYVKGVTNLRGSVVPVVGLSERLGWAPSELHSRSCILVVTIGGRHAGFLVDEVQDIVVIQGSEIQPAPDVEINEQGAIAGLVKIERRTHDAAANAEAMCLLLDLDALSLTRQVPDFA
ncbi:purine-binding chemotaxis protein CheW [Novosphingobium sp. PhB57]|jgi:purine-binding chemotaxis protein CheW|uniref:chemotaxis protein CheW n=1 Tax=unclassified Novosphingobium TaxID=2644732 RepID=UPI00104C3DAA|nr:MULTISPECIES: chemotaxis protein CheW [unclassified Novosphingobium]TCU56155.1 purine-binding chemotaxis protein CheW [Novosphingobium sp. PhB57]TDW65294.1 purine-binding chemotaxis protein CheW [Novosphingobium sp. PhB55]